jgi:hypothetical protein
LEATHRHGKEFERLCRIGARLAIDVSAPAIHRLIICACFASPLKIDRCFVSGVATNLDDAGGPYLSRKLKFA